MATQNIRYRAGTLEVLLHQAQLFTGSMVVVWIENFGQFFRVDALLFGTTYSPAYLYYDRRERVTRIDCYITHGSLEYYFFYKDDGDRPDYCLKLDFMGDCLAGMVRY